MPEYVTDETCPEDAARSLVLQQRLESLLNARVEPVSLMMLASLPEPALGYRLIRGELGISVSLLTHGGSIDTPTQQRNLAGELSAAVAALDTFCAELEPAGDIEKLVVTLRKIIRWVVLQAMPCRLRKTVLLLTTHICWQLWARVGVAQDFHKARVHLLSCVLHEPAKSVATLLRQHQFYLQWNFSRRLRHLSQDSTGDGSFCWPERESYLGVDRRCTQSRVLVTIHMGDFFGAFKHIADALDDARAVISLRREGDTNALKKLSARHADSHQVFIHGGQNAWQIVQRLRSGKHTLAVLFDLGGDFGETTTVSFFGHPARFVRGPAELAILGRAWIYAFVCFAESGRNLISMEPPLVPDIRAEESLQDAVTRVTQQLVTMAERWISKHPAQWKYLDRLPSYLVPDPPQRTAGMPGRGGNSHAQ